MRPGGNRLAPRYRCSIQKALPEWLEMHGGKKLTWHTGYRWRSWQWPWGAGLRRHRLAEATGRRALRLDAAGAAGVPRRSPKPNIMNARFRSRSPSIFAGQAWGLGPLPRLALPCISHVQNSFQDIVNDSFGKAVPRFHANSPSATPSRISATGLTEPRARERSRASHESAGYGINGKRRLSPNDRSADAMPCVTRRQEAPLCLSAPLCTSL